MIPLFVPGPCTVSDAVREAQARAPVYHRGEEYGRLLREVSAMLGEVLGTAGEVHCVCSSGTGTIEMALQNVCRPGDRIVVPSNGYFGERLADMGRRLGLDVVHLRGDWTDSLPHEEVDRALRCGAIALLAIHHETSTGRVNDVARLGVLCREHGALCMIDAISSAGILPVEMDQHDLDVVIATSQKGIGATPGVGVLTASRRVWQRLAALPAPATLACDWAKVRRSFHRDPAESQWTPPVSVMAGLHAALMTLTRNQPVAEVYGARAAVGRAVRAGMCALGFMPWPAGAADVAPVTVAQPPHGVDTTALLAAARRSCGVELGPGQGRLAGRVVRVSHIGIELFHVLGLVGTIDVAIEQLTGARPGSPAARAWRAFVEPATDRR